MLFVAEKAAALDVVHSRLKAVGLEPLCLELHSRKATKAAVVASLDRALSTGGAVPLAPGLADSLRTARDRLNGWSETLHRPIGKSARTPYHVMGQVLQLHAENIKPLNERLDAPGEWDAEHLTLAEYSVDRAAAAVTKLGLVPVRHPWRGATGERLNPFDFDRLRETLTVAREHVAALSARFDVVRHALATTVEYRMQDIGGVTSGLRHLARMPPDGRATLVHAAWRSSRGRISSLVDQGYQWTERRTELAKRVTEVVWSTELGPIRRTIAVFGQSTFRVLRGEYRRAIAELNSFCSGPPPKAYDERIGLLDDLILAQEARRSIASASNFAEAVLGDLWAGEDSSWSKFETLVYGSRAATRRYPALTFSERK